MDNEIIYLKKSNKIKALLIILTIILGLGISLGLVYYMYYQKDARENSLNTGIISINYTEGNSNINMTSTPMIDDEGINNTAYTFTITNTSNTVINTKISIENNNSTIDIRAIKYALYVNDTLIKKDYLPNNLTLYTYENMPVGESINCKVVFWVDYYYTNTIANETFSAKIKVEGVSKDIIGATITLNPNGGTISPTTVVIDKSATTYGELPEPTREGYNFVGWFTAASGGTEVTPSTSFTYGTSPQTLYAHWEEESSASWHYGLDNIDAGSCSNDCEINCDLGFSTSVWGCSTSNVDGSTPTGSGQYCHCYY